MRGYRVNMRVTWLGRGPGIGAGGGPPSMIVRFTPQPARGRLPVQAEAE